jgi:hypothetical protein
MLYIIINCSQFSLLVIYLVILIATYTQVNGGAVQLLIALRQKLEMTLQSFTSHGFHIMISLQSILSIASCFCRVEGIALLHCIIWNLGPKKFFHVCSLWNVRGKVVSVLSLLRTLSWRQIRERRYSCVIRDLRTRQKWVVRLTPRSLYPAERAPSKLWIEGFIGPEFLWPIRGRKKDVSFAENGIPGFQPIAHLYIDWTILAYVCIHMICEMYKCCVEYTFMKNAIYYPFMDVQVITGFRLVSSSEIQVETHCNLMKIRMPHTFFEYI